MASSATKSRKPGRPAKEPAELVRISSEILTKARSVAPLLGFRSVTDYLNDKFAGPVDDDFRRETAAKK